MSASRCAKPLVELNADARTLTTVIDDHSVTVNVDATNDRSTPVFGDAFMGNKVTVDGKFDQSGRALGIITEAQQVMNPDITSAADNFEGKPGANTLHGVTEAYQGAKISQLNGVSSGPPTYDNKGNQAKSVYSLAHKLAQPQAGNVYVGYADGKGGILWLQNSQPPLLKEQLIFLSSL